MSAGKASPDVLMSVADVLSRIARKGTTALASVDSPGESTIVTRGILGLSKVTIAEPRAISSPWERTAGHSILRPLTNVPFLLPASRMTKPPPARSMYA